MQLPVQKNQAWHFEPVSGQFLQHLHRRRRALCGFRLLHHRVLELLEQNLAELSGRVEVELRPRFLENLFLQFCQLHRHGVGHLAKESAVDLDPSRFHARQHRDQRHLDGLVNPAQSVVAAKLRIDNPFQRQHGVWFLSEVLQIRAHRTRADLVIDGEQRRGLRNVLPRQNVLLEPVADHISEGMGGESGIDHVGHDHGVDDVRRERPATGRQPPDQQLQIVRHQRFARG